MVQLPQMPALQDLDNLLSHPLSNPRDAKSLLEEEEAEAGNITKSKTSKNELS